MQKNEGVHSVYLLERGSVRRIDYRCGCVLGIINDKVVSLGAFNVVELLIFLAAFLWFQSQLRKAREQFL